MNKSDFQLTGVLAKLHGYKGDFTLISDNYLNENIESKESVFVEIDGLLIPFFVSSIRLTSDNTAIIGFDDIDSSEAAKEYLGCSVYSDKGTNDENTEDAQLAMLIGYSVFDTKKGFVGRVTDVLDYSNNVLLEIKKEKQEILIPVSDKIVVSVNHKKKEIQIKAPEGLLTLND